MLNPHLERRLENCMPDWLQRIHDAKYVADLLKPKKNLKIEAYQCCLVGEIYGFRTSDYDGCSTCKDYSLRFFNLTQSAKKYFCKPNKSKDWMERITKKEAEKFNKGYQSELEDALKSFLGHLRTTHPIVYANCKCKVNKN